MSKVRQSKNAQRLKRDLKALGVKKRFCVSQESGYDYIIMWVSDTQYMNDDNALMICFDDCDDFGRLTYDEGTTILDNPTLHELAEYLKTN